MKFRLFRGSRRVGERGEGQTQLIVTLTIIGLIGFVAYKIVPVYWQDQNVKYEVQEINRKVSIGSPKFQKDEEIKDQIRKMLDENQVPADAKFSCTKAAGSAVTTVSYTTPIEFYVYTYNWETSIEAKDGLAR